MKKQKKENKPKKVRWSWQRVAVEEGIMVANSGGSREAAQQKILDLGNDKSIFTEAKESALREACQTILLKDKTREELEKEATEAKANLSMTAQQKLEAALRMHKRLLDMDLDEQVEALVTEKLAEILPLYRKEYTRYKKFSKAYKGVFSLTEYKSLLSCLHPDREAKAERKGKMFDLIKQNKELLCGVENTEDTPSSLPGSVSELMAMRKSKRH